MVSRIDPSDEIDGTGLMLRAAFASRGTRA